MSRKLSLSLVFLLVMIIIPVSNVHASEWSWKGCPIEIGDETTEIYEIVPNVILFPPASSIKSNPDIFPEGAPLTEELRKLANENKYGNGVEAAKTVFQRLADKMGKERVSETMEGTYIYLLPSFSFANLLAEKRGGKGIVAVIHSDTIWIDADCPPEEWINALMHELGHRLDYYYLTSSGQRISSLIYPEEVRDSTTKCYFGSLKWDDDPREWFAEAFTMHYGFPNLLRYPSIKKYDELGLKPQIQKSLDFLDGRKAKEAEVIYGGKEHPKKD